MNHPRRPRVASAALFCLAALAACDQDLQGTRGLDAGRLGAASDGADGIQCPDGKRPSEDGTGCVDDVTPCGPEFPCPLGQRCIEGACRDLRDPCAMDNECPVGERCVRGLCQPDCPADARCRADVDCGDAAKCVACYCVSVRICARPTPEVTGAPWKVVQDLYVDDAFGALGKTFNDIMQRLRDGILGCPKGSDPGCQLFEIVGDALPEWARILIVVVGDFADVIENDAIHVVSEMTLKPQARPLSFEGEDHWLTVSFSYENMQITKRPEDLPQIGKPVRIPIKASAQCSVLFVDRHTLDGLIGGILRFVLDSVIEYETCTRTNNLICIKSLPDAIDLAINCGLLPGGAARDACIDFRTGLKRAIDALITGWLGDWSLLSLEGTAVIVDDKELAQGRWDGQIGGRLLPFHGTWSGKR